MFESGFELLEFALDDKNGKCKGSVLLLMELHLTATGCHLSYEITQCYLPPDTGEHTPP